MPNEELPNEELPAVLEEKNGRSFKELLLYKIDRTLAIAGLVAIGLAVCFTKVEDPSTQIAIAVIGALGVYIGGRGKQEGGTK